MSALLSVSDVHIAYGKVEAVRGVSLDVHDNEIVTIVGANGAGKTTLLNAVMGILPLKGRVSFAGEDMAPFEIEDRVALGMSLVAEHRELFSTMHSSLEAFFSADQIFIVNSTRSLGENVAMVAQFGQVEAGGKVVADAVDHDRPDIIGQVGEAVADREDDAVIERVALGRAVKTHCQHGAPLLQLQRRGHFRMALCRYCYII